MRIRGSVLIVILGLLAVLAVVGIAFVTMSSIESNTASNFALQAQFDLAADGAVDYVCQALVRDVWEYGTNPATPDKEQYRTYTGWMLTSKYGTQHWDYPFVTTLSTDPKVPTQDAFLAWSADYWTVAPQPATTAYSFRATVTGLNSTLTPYNLKTWGGYGPSGSGSGNTAFYSTSNTSTSVTVDVSPNNLGIPKTGTTVLWYDPPNGLWIPELACPFENGIIRVSVTVLDHAAMVNLNAHGSPIASSGPWAPYGSAAGKGYFVSDLSPAGVSGWLTSFPSTNIKRLLDGSLTPPGRWRDASGPGNMRLGEIFMQNPGADPTLNAPKDRPFGLDDEFELRRMTGTYATSRLEQIILGSLDSTPLTTTPAKVKARLSLTTVGWNAEIIPAQNGLGTAAPKCDINLAGDLQSGGTNFLSALGTGGVIDPTPNKYLNLCYQFTANVLSFAERYKPTDGNYFKSYNGANGAFGARRQLILSKVKVNVTPGAPGPPVTPDSWTIRVQVFYPWVGDYAGDPNTGMDSSKYTLRANFSGTSKNLNGGKVGDGPPYMVPNKGVWDCTTTINNVGNGKTLTDITLEVPGPGVVDKILLNINPTTTPLTNKYRIFGVYPEPRGVGDTDPSSVVTVVYVKDWQPTPGDDNWGPLLPQGGLNAILPGNGIPIRFPHSVPIPDTNGASDWICGKQAGGADGKGPLPPYYDALGGDAGSLPYKGVFKAFLRVADLNQVLCPKDETEAKSTFWPWLPRVATASGIVATTPPAITQEILFKWDWWPSTDVSPYTLPLCDSTAGASGVGVRQFRRYNGGNVFCVDSPWYDSLDNDGDGVKDAEDTGSSKDFGRFCGPEIRVAGRINLNTATDYTLKALGLSLTGDETKYTTSITGKRPLRSPVEILRSPPTVTPLSGFLGGPLEKRDYPYTLISNIATVRSDTFSIYGTVQYLQLLKGYNQAAATTSLADIKIVRTRRFWALVDRSPALSFRPDNNSFIHPRVLNFQWLD